MPELFSRDVHKDFSRPIRLTIAMTGGDVNGGIPWGHCNCAIASAVNRATDLFSLVDGRMIYLYRTPREAQSGVGHIACAPLPESAIRFITVYDGLYGMGMASAPDPITFTAAFTPFVPATGTTQEVPLD